MTRIIQISHELPLFRYDQEQVTDCFIKHFAKLGVSERVIRRFHKGSKVQTRYFTSALEEYLSHDSLQARINHSFSTGIAMATKAVAKALKSANYDACEVDRFSCTTSNAIGVPSLDAYLLNQFEFRDDISRCPVFGLGCAGGATGLSMARDYLASNPKHLVLHVCTEVYSTALFQRDRSVANIVGSSLFNDGATAALCVGREHPDYEKGTVEVLASQGHFFKDTLDYVGGRPTEYGYETLIDSKVPKLIETSLRALVGQFLERNSLNISDLDHYVIHTGGPRVLQAVQKSLEITEEDLWVSWEVMRDHGNMGSNSVLRVLNKTLEKSPKKNSLGLLMGYGPGMYADLSLIKFT